MTSHKLPVTISDPELVEKFHSAIDHITAVRRISNTQFAYEALCYWLTLPPYQRDAAIQGNVFKFRGPGRPCKEER